MLPDAADEYYERYKDELEHHLTEAMSEVMIERREDPLIHLTECLLRSQHKAAHEGVAAAKRSAFAAASPLELVVDPASCGEVDSAGPAEMDKWNVASWLGGLQPTALAPVAAALLVPLGDSPPPHVALHFVRSLGGNREAVRYAMSTLTAADAIPQVSTCSPPLGVL